MYWFSKVLDLVHDQAFGHESWFLCGATDDGLEYFIAVGDCGNIPFDIENNLSLDEQPFPDYFYKDFTLDGACRKLLYQHTKDQREKKIQDDREERLKNEEKKP